MRRWHVGIGLDREYALPCAHAGQFWLSTAHHDVAAEGVVVHSITALAAHLAVGYDRQHGCCRLMAELACSSLIRVVLW